MMYNIVVSSLRLCQCEGKFPKIPESWLTTNIFSYKFSERKFSLMKLKAALLHSFLAEPVLRYILGSCLAARFSSARTPPIQFGSQPPRDANNLNGAKLWFIIVVMSWRSWYLRDGCQAQLINLLISLCNCSRGVFRLSTRRSTLLEWKNQKYRSLIFKNKESQCQTTRGCFAERCEWALVGSSW